MYLNRTIFWPVPMQPQRRSTRTCLGGGVPNKDVYSPRLAFGKARATDRGLGSSLDLLGLALFCVCVAVVGRG